MKRGLLALLAALVVAPTAHAGGPTLALGAAEDVVRSPSAPEAQANMKLLRLAGFRAVRITSIWAPGQTAPDEVELGILRNVATAAGLNGVRVYVSVYHAGSRTTPLTPEARGELADYAASIVHSVPSFRDVIVGNEPNLNRFWLPQFNADGTGASAPAYLELLATAYDRLKAVTPAVRVYGGALAPRGVDRPGTGRDTISPTRFLRELGAAYRASGRALPVMDALAFHPYADNSSKAPDLRPADPDHLGLVDYDRLVGLLAEAFDGTAQPGSLLPILYDEFGVETVVPEAKAAAYTGTEPTTTRPVDEATQAAYYRRALQLAYCQPNVVGMLLFHTHDEPALGAWQSGVYYADGTPKTSLPAVRQALAATRGGSIARCGVPLTLKPKVTWSTRTRSLSLRCDLDCAYRARLVRLPAGTASATVNGRVGAATPVTVTLRRPVRTGRYRLELSLVHPVNPAPARVLRSAAFNLP